jgi:hypothetical protein
MLKNRLSKLEKTQRDRQLDNSGIYVAFIDGDTMEVKNGQDLIFSGFIERGEKMLKELNIPDSFIIRVMAPMEWAN